MDNSNINEWTEKIRLIVNDAKLNRQLGNGGRAWVKNRFSWRIIARQVEELIISEVYGNPDAFKGRSS